MVHLHLWLRTCDITKRTKTSTSSTVYVPGKDLGNSNFILIDFAVINFKQQYVQAVSCEPDVMQMSSTCHSEEQKN